MPQFCTTIAVAGAIVAFHWCLTASTTSGFAFTAPPSKSHQVRDQLAGVRVFRAVLREPQSRWTEQRRWPACSMKVRDRRVGCGTLDPLRFGDAFRSRGESCHGDDGNDRKPRRFKSSQKQYMRKCADEGTTSPIPLFRQDAKVKNSSKTKLRVLNVGVDDVGANFLKERAISALAGVGGEGAGPHPASANAASAHANGSDMEQGQGRGWEYWGYRALLLGVAAIMGTNFPVSPIDIVPRLEPAELPERAQANRMRKVKFVENHAAIPDASAAFVRFSIAAGAMLPFADWKQKDVLVAGLEVGVWMAIGYCTQAIGLQTSEASVCAFLCSLTVVFVPLFGAVFGNGIKLVTVVASLLALLGTGFLELGDASASWSDLWCVAQAVAFAMGFLRIEHYMHKFPGQSLQLSIGQLVTIAASTGVWCAWSSGGHVPDFSFLQDPQIAAASGYTGFITTALALWLQTVALENVSAAEMSVIFTTEPMWATAVSVIFLKETMGPNAALGAGFILLACLTAQSEHILELVGLRTKTGDAINDTEVNGVILDDDAPAMVADGGEGREDNALATSISAAADTDEVLEKAAQPKTLAMVVRDEQGLEISTAELSGDVLKAIVNGDEKPADNLPSLNQYVVSMDIYTAEEGFIVEEEMNGVPSERSFEYSPAPVKELT